MMDSNLDQTAAAVDRLSGPEGFKLEEYVQWLRCEFPHLADIVADVASLDETEKAKKTEMLFRCSEFSEGGRGVQWAATVDEHLEARKGGAGILLMSSIPNVTSPDLPETDQRFVLLDVFGGAGFIAQFADSILGFKGTVLTSDPSALMVRLALKKGLPALWQRAQDLFMTRDDSVDAVLFAYGTHHVPPSERDQSFREAWRVLKPGGSLIVHDFEEKSHTTRWFSEVVDQYTRTGHKHEHFTPSGLLRHFQQADFEACSTSHIDDSFCFRGSTANEAVAETVRFMASAYGLEKLPRTAASAAWLWRQIRDFFWVEELSNGDPGGAYQVIIHRLALLGVGRKMGRA